MSNANRSVGSLIVSELDAIRYTHAPVSVPAYTIYFASTMTDRVPSDGSSLFLFLSSLKLHSLRDGILRLLLNNEARRLLTQHDELARLKENAVAEQQFELAARKRDAQCVLLAQLNRLLPSPAEVHPIHILNVIRNLGFDGPLPNPQ